LDGHDRDRLRRLVADCVALPVQGGWGRAMCQLCVRVLPSADSAALTLRSPSHGEEMIGSADELATSLEETQYTLGEGPGVEAFATGRVVLVPDLARERGRWPVFADVGLEAGVASVFAFPLGIGGIRLGTLDLYGRRTGDLASGERADAVVLADLAALALTDQIGRTGTEYRSAVSYQEVNIATGMLAAQLRISLEDAFARLRGHAYAVDRSVIDVARDVLAHRISLDLPRE
jgi:GAF domain